MQNTKWYSTNSFHVFPLTITAGVLVQGHHEAYVLSAQSQEEMDEWMTAISNSVLSNPLHQLIASRAKSKNQNRTGQTALEKENKEKGTVFDLRLILYLTNRWLTKGQFQFAVRNGQYVRYVL